MANNSFPVINGLRPSFADVVITISNNAADGATAALKAARGVATQGGLLPAGVLRGIKAINFKDGLKPKFVRGTSVAPIGRTRGEYEASGSIELYIEEFKLLQFALTPGGAGFMEIPFDITINYAILTSDAAITETLQACRITEADQSYSLSDEALVVKCSLSIMQVLRNKASSTLDPVQFGSTPG